MKITQLTIHNIGLIEDEVISINRPLIIFYGDIRQGKSTVLQSVRWCLGGSFPDDIIRHGAKEAFVELTFEGGSIRREWYVSTRGTSAGQTRARDVVFIRNGKAVQNPAHELKKLLNPFLLNQNHFAEMNELERKRFMVELFAVDTTAEDAELSLKEAEASKLRSKLDGYGEIDLTPVEAVEVGPLREELQKIRETYDAECDKVNSTNANIAQDNATIQRALDRIGNLKNEIDDLERDLDAKKQELARIKPGEKREPLAKPAKPDTTELEAKIQNSAAQNVRAEQYKKNLERETQRKADETALSNATKRIKELREAKISKLKEASASTGIDGLTFSETGDFSFNGTTAGMLSTSELMTLSQKLSEKYPAGFDLSLVDRGESLGKSIYSLITHAQANERTIMATVVGDAPAKSPPEVGVWVVEQGKVKAPAPKQEGELL